MPLAASAAPVPPAPANARTVSDWLNPVRLGVDVTVALASTLRSDRLPDLGGSGLRVHPRDERPGQTGSGDRERLTAGLRSIGRREHQQELPGRRCADRWRRPRAAAVGEDHAVDPKASRDRRRRLIGRRAGVPAAVERDDLVVVAAARQRSIGERRSRGLPDQVRWTRREAARRRAIDAVRRHRWTARGRGPRQVDGAGQDGRDEIRRGWKKSGRRHDDGHDARGRSSASTVDRRGRQLIAPGQDGGPGERVGRRELRGEGRAVAQKVDVVDRAVRIARRRRQVEVDRCQVVSGRGAVEAHRRRKVRAQQRAADSELRAHVVPDAQDTGRAAEGPAFLEKITASRERDSVRGDALRSEVEPQHLLRGAVEHLIA